MLTLTTVGFNVLVPELAQDPFLGVRETLY
jgi:hypothetical protein